MLRRSIRWLGCSIGGPLGRGGVAILLGLFVLGASVIVTLRLSPSVPPANAGPGTAERSSGPNGFQPERVVPQQPPITEAPVVAAHEIGDRVTDGELVLGVVVNGKARAYPINMLTGPRREIINDTLGGRPIAATW